MDNATDAHAAISTKSNAKITIFFSKITGALGSSPEK